MKYGVKMLVQDPPGTEFSDVVSLLLWPECKGVFSPQFLAKGGAVAGRLVCRCCSRPAEHSPRGNSV